MQQRCEIDAQNAHTFSLSQENPFRRAVSPIGNANVSISATTMKRTYSNAVQHNAKIIKTTNDNINKYSIQ